MHRQRRPRKPQLASSSPVGQLPPPGVSWALELRSVTRSYRSGDTAVTALDAVSVAFEYGSWTAVMGPSGSGKSTLLNCAGGLERPTAGRVVVAGRDITDDSEAQLTRLRHSTVGFVFQHFNLIGSLTAEQNVALPLRLAGRGVSKAHIRQILRDVGLGERLDHRPRELSGGQQQRVAIARAMACRPDVLLADEPTGALDSHAAKSILTMLRSIVDSGQTIVMVTHDPLAAASADAVVFLSDGCIVDQLAGPSPREVADRLARMQESPAHVGSPA